MNWTHRKLLAAGLIVGVGALGSSCSSVAENDFDEILNFQGFYTDGDCNTGLAGVVLDLDPGLETGEGLCGLGEPCIIGVNLINETTGVPIPGTGATGTQGPPVPSNDGVRIQTKRVRIEYGLPFGSLPGREFAINANIDPTDEFCFAFLFLGPEDSVSMVQNPEAFPELPFNMTARVTVEGVTEAGYSIRTQSDINVFVTQIDQTIDQ